MRAAGGICSQRNAVFQGGLPCYAGVQMLINGVDAYLLNDNNHCMIHVIDSTGWDARARRTHDALLCSQRDVDSAPLTSTANDSRRIAGRGIAQREDPRSGRSPKYVAALVPPLPR